MTSQKIEKPVLAVLRRQEPQRRPIWFMRQAGRYLPEYQAVRAKAGSFLNLCYTPALACEVSLQPLKRFDLDAVILFADILVVPHAMGVSLSFDDGEGPILSRVEGSSDVGKLGRVLGSSQVEAVCETVSKVRKGLPGTVGLIGFCGGPWTVASYMVEGRSSDRELAARLAYGREGWFGELVDRLVEESVCYLCGQIAAGAEVVQIFDSWAGDLTGEARERFVLGPLGRLVAGVKEVYPSVPIIVFGRGLGIDHVAVSHFPGVDCVGVESGIRLDWVAGNVSSGCAVQGNLDPVVLLTDKAAAGREARLVAQSIPARRHIFNLGHGLRRQTSIETIRAVIGAVRSLDAGVDG